VGDTSTDNVAWSYQQPLEPVAAIKSLIAFYADRVDAIEVEPLVRE
jgi:uncharacterized protein (DUF427 family)